MHTEPCTMSIQVDSKDMLYIILFVSYVCHCVQVCSVKPHQALIPVLQRHQVLIPQRRVVDQDGGELHSLT